MQHTIKKYNTMQTLITCIVEHGRR